MDEDDPFWSVQMTNNAENNRPYTREAPLEYQVLCSLLLYLLVVCTADLLLIVCTEII